MTTNNSAAREKIGIASLFKKRAPLLKISSHRPSRNVIHESHIQNYVTQNMRDKIPSYF